MAFDLDPHVFFDETSVQLKQTQDLLENVLNGDTIDIAEIFRHIHSIKGNASIFEFDKITEIAHEYETILSVYRENSMHLTAKSATELLDVAKLLETLTHEYVEYNSINGLEESISDALKKLTNQHKVALFQLRKLQFQQMAEKQNESNDDIQVDKKTILIVDDSSMIRNVAVKAAEENGHIVLSASDGSEGFEIAKNNSDIDLIFSDVNMPNMGGLEMAENIKKLPNHKFTPIVMMTTETDGDLKSEGKQLGVKAWLVKPFNKNKFLLVIEKILNL
jgi:two-component system chemotaxis response regulator CheY